MGELEALVVRMAEENRVWGYRRIQEALANLGYVLAHNTIAKILRQHGIHPSPERRHRATWKEFLSHNWGSRFVASDHFTADVWTPKGLPRCIVLYFMELST